MINIEPFKKIKRDNDEVLVLKPAILTKPDAKLLGTLSYEIKNGSFLNTRSGLVFKDDDEIEISKIVSIKTRTTVASVLLGFNSKDLVFITSDKKITWKNVPHPNKVKALINNIKTFGPGCLSEGHKNAYMSGNGEIPFSVDNTLFSKRERVLPNIVDIDRLLEHKIDLNPVKIIDLAKTGEINDVFITPDEEKIVVLFHKQETLVFDARSFSVIKKVANKVNDSDCFIGEGRRLHSPDGKFFVNVGWTEKYRNAIEVFETENWTVIQRIEYEEEYGRIDAFVFSPDSRYMAFATEYNEYGKGGTVPVHIWDTSTWEKVGVIYSGRFSINTDHILFTSDSEQMIIQNREGRDKICLTLHNWRSAEEIQVTDNSGYNIALSPSGYDFACLDRDTLRIWDTKTWLIKEFINLPKDSYDSLCFSPDGARLYVSSAKKNIYSFDTQTWELSKVFYLENFDALDDLCDNLMRSNFSRGQRNVFLFGYDYQAKKIGIWKLPA